jgi:hypothetical protein
MVQSLISKAILVALLVTGFQVKSMMEPDIEGRIDGKPVNATRK